MEFALSKQLWKYKGNSYFGTIQDISIAQYRNLQVFSVIFFEFRQKMLKFKENLKFQTSKSEKLINVDGLNKAVNSGILTQNKQPWYHVYSGGKSNMIMMHLDHLYEKRGQAAQDFRVERLTC